MTTEMGHHNRLDLATRRLDRALALLEQRLAHRMAEAGARVGGLFDQDRAQLAAELDAARARERALAEAGAEASTALAAAMEELRRHMGPVSCLEAPPAAVDAPAPADRLTQRSEI
jgi:hypothetical protein